MLQVGMSKIQSSMIHRPHSYCDFHKMKPTHRSQRLAICRSLCKHITAQPVRIHPHSKHNILGIVKTLICIWNCNYFSLSLVPLEIILVSAQQWTSTHEAPNWIVNTFLLIDFTKLYYYCLIKCIINRAYCSIIMTDFLNKKIYFTFIR